MPGRGCPWDQPRKHPRHFQGGNWSPGREDQGSLSARLSVSCTSFCFSRHVASSDRTLRASGAGGRRLDGQRRVPRAYHSARHRRVAQVRTERKTEPMRGTQASPSPPGEGEKSEHEDPGPAPLPQSARQAGGQPGPTPGPVRSLLHAAGQGPTGDTGKSGAWRQGRSQDLRKLGALGPPAKPPGASPPPPTLKHEMGTSGKSRGLVRGKGEQCRQRCMWQPASPRPSHEEGQGTMVTQGAPVPGC